MLARSRPSPIDSIVSVLAALTAVMVLVVIVSLGLQGRLGDNAAPATRLDNSVNAPSMRVDFEDTQNPVSIQCQSAPGDSPGTELFSVTIENQANEARNYEVLVELLSLEAEPVEGYASVTAVQPFLQTTAGISLRSSPGVAATTERFSACRVVALESGQRVFRAN